MSFQKGGHTNDISYKFWVKSVSGSVYPHRLILCPAITAVESLSLYCCIMQ